MKFLYRTLIVFALLVMGLGVQAQVPQDLINKAKAAGMTDAQIQQEIAKYTKDPQTTTGRVQTAGNATVSDRSVLATQSDTIQRQHILNDRIDTKDIVFGREIFANRNLSFEPDLNIPTPKNYRLAAGDELLISVWGDSEMNLKLRISPEGTILVPNLGPVALSGLTIDQAEGKLKNELGKIMTSLANGDANAFVSVSLSQIRSIKVNMVGELVSPGTYTLPSFATLFNALYAAGGVNNIGSLRSIKVFRDSKQVADLDVYNYLLNGVYDTNIRLEENDMVIVGTYDQLVRINGEVKRNRIFELKPGETLEQLLIMSGGFTGEAYTKDIQVKRRTDTRYQIATVKNEKFGQFEMQDGDEVTVGAVVPFYENRVVINGAVWRPGEYELTDQVRTVKQLVDQAAGLKGDEFAGRAQITRLNPDFTTTLIAVDIKGILNGTTQDVALQREDSLHIPSLFDLREPYTVTVRGAVNTPGEQPYRHNLTIEDVIVMAGGLREAAATTNVEVARRIKDADAETVSRKQAEVFNFTLNENMQLQQSGKLFTLEPFDEVYVRFFPGYEAQKVVMLDGEITFKGNYVLSEKNMRLSDVIANAGGLTPDAYVKGASLKRKLSEDELQRIETILRLSANKASQDSIDIASLDLNEYAVGIDLERALQEPGSLHDLVLRDGDVLYVPQMRNTVKISGAVTYPNSVTFQPNMSVRQALAQAGGYNDIARKYPIVIYMNGQVATTKKVMIFFKKHPKLEPGCEVLVPTKTMTDRRGVSLVEIMSIANSTTSMAAMVTSLINMLDNNK